MTSYFTATTDDAAIVALEGLRDNDETLTTPIGPADDAFTALIELVYGDSLPADQGCVTIEAAETTQGLVRIGARLRDTVAEMDESTFQDLAEPWQSDDRIRGTDLDAADFLIDFQHLCRNARAISGDVYAVEDF